MKDFKAACLYGAATLLISLIIFGPFALRSPTFTLASLQAQGGKSSYQTVWAIIDGNTTTGNFGPLADHFDPAKAATPINNPARIPTWLTLIPFGLLGLFIFTRPRPLPPRLSTSMRLSSPPSPSSFFFSGHRAGVPSGKLS